MEKLGIRLIGDIHGSDPMLNRIISTQQRHDLTIQIGDFGIGFGAETALKRMDSNKVKVLAGNHDDYNKLAEYPHNLGRFGVFEYNGKKIFYVCGAWSIDWMHRTPGRSWWSTEELSLQEANDCLDLWQNVNKEIDIVITHDGPQEVTKNILGRWPYDTLTGGVFIEMLKIRRPPRWYFGHWHVSYSETINNTKFRCINIDEELVI